MHDFTCTSAGEMHYPVLADRVRYFKEDVKGVATMCREVEKIAMEERMEERMETKASALPSVIDEFSVSAEDAMRILKISEDEKEKYRKLLNE